MPPDDRVARVGQCLDCRHARLVRSPPGQTYYRCGRSDDEGRYPRYPRLPVLSCDGFDAVELVRDETDPADASR